MPRTRVGDVELYYEEHGRGVPVVLIHGLAGDCGAWKAQVEVMKKEFRVLAFDNRGAGRSSAPDYPYTSRHFAADTAGLMDAVGIREPAHIIGRSMGGAIAQEIALGWPGRVRSMIITASFGKLDRYGHQILHNINEVVKAQGYAAAAKHQSPMTPWSGCPGSSAPPSSWRGARMSFARRRPRGRSPGGSPAAS
ncbi:MAG: alpha/beta hydrolase [Candidatus Tectomicrobia bacterium]|nr:alpha/beta hydrolase [Candidatus Tectomicrobia bacterium]